MTARKTSTTDKPTGKRAPPTVFSPELGEKICARLAEGLGVTKISRLVGMPNRATIFRWLAAAAAEPGDTPLATFLQAYLRAREIRADARYERIDDVIEDMRAKKIDAQQARVEIEAIKWQCGKENQGRYSDKVTVRGDTDAPLTVVVRRASDDV